jgi:hypothetical protein
LLLGLDFVGDICPPVLILSHGNNLFDLAGHNLSGLSKSVRFFPTVSLLKISNLSSFVTFLLMRNKFN